MRVIAILAVYNEERFIRNCLNHLITQGVEVYIVDNESTDDTANLAEDYLGKGVIGIETLPRHGMYSWRPILQRKEQLASELEGDWFLHVDADEIRLPPYPHTTLLEALQQADTEGYNAVNFQEFTFTPTLESPDHDHPDYISTLRWYYPFLPSFPHRLNAWKRQPSVDLAGSGGHKVKFPSLKMYPASFPMKHYLFLSVKHALKKYAHKIYDPKELAVGWHGGRARVSVDNIRLPSRQLLKEYIDDRMLDAGNPRKKHYLFEPLESR